MSRHREVTINEAQLKTPKKFYHIMSNNKTSNQVDLEL